MTIVNRIPLQYEPIKGTHAVNQYDKGARYYMMPEYKYFVWKILRRGIHRGKVLDIGTGSGRLAIELAKVKNCDFKISAIDVSTDMLELAKKNAIQAGVADKIDFILANGDSIPFHDGSFDLVMSYASLHHWFHPEKVFSEAGRVAGDRGTVIIRDNRRVYGNLFWEAFIRLLLLFMNKRHRQNWPKAIMASYTIPEIKDIVSRSGIKDYRTGTDFIKFDLFVETARK
jgi:ubiquinone/menaquinone biosynthesis C-methylase UbiE